MSWGDYESSTTRALRSIDSAKYNKDFVQNIQSLNYATDFMADYMVVMQKGIDDANKDIIQKIQDFIEDLIIIFGGGSTGDSGFDFGDLGYIIQAIGALFGFSGSGPIDLIGAAGHFLVTFGEAAINGFIKAVFEFFAGLLSNVPIVGSTLHDIVTNMANGINTTTSTANNAQSTANTANTAASNAQSTANSAQSTANTANTNASAALSTANSASSTATAAQTAASNAATVAAAAQTKADIAYNWASYREKEFSVTTSGLVLGKNEQPIGILLAVPPSSIIKITRLVYTLQSNTGTATVQFIRRALNGTETVIWTSNIPSSVIVYDDNGIDYQITDLDHFLCNVTAITGVQTVLNCYVEYAILPA